jgi:hypothetical protein
MVVPEDVCWRLWAVFDDAREVDCAPLVYMKVRRSQDVCGRHCNMRKLNLLCARAVCVIMKR